MYQGVKMENERFVNIRVETIKDYDSYLKITKHNSRAIKEKRVVNKNGFINENEELILGFKNNYAKNLVKEAKQNFFEIRNEHKQLSKYFHNQRSRSLANGILYFSKGINEDYQNNPKEFFERTKKMLKQFEEDQKSEILNFQIHKDEIGNVHVHFIFKNFNSENGKSLNFTKNKKQGEYLQDLSFNHFKDFGQNYIRGIKKSRSEKHLSIEDYKLKKEAEKELLLVKSQNEELRSDNAQLLEDNQKLSEDIQSKENKLKVIQNEHSEIRLEILEITNEFDKVVNDFEEFLLLENDKDKFEKLKSIFQRHSKNENKEKMLMSLRKTKKHISKVKDKYSRKTIR